jgi:hypothetical protein
LLWPGHETPGGLGELGSQSYKELKLENKVTAMEGRLNESEIICSTQKKQIKDLNLNLCEANRSIKNLENRNIHIKVALSVLGILFTLSLIILCFSYQSGDLFVSFYVAIKHSLNALMTNPLFHKLYGLKVSTISSALF